MPLVLVCHVFRLPKNTVIPPNCPSSTCDYHLHQHNSARASQGDAAGEKEKLQFEMKWSIMSISITTADIYASAIKDCS